MAKSTTVDSKSVKADKPAKSSKSAQPAKPNFFARMMQYFRDVRSEMKRVVWPSRPEVLNSSVVVVVTLIFFVVFTLIVDNIVIQLLKLWAQVG